MLITVSYSYFFTLLVLVRYPSVVYNCNVAPRLLSTGSNDIFPRSVTAQSRLLDLLGSQIYSFNNRQTLQETDSTSNNDIYQLLTSCDYQLTEMTALNRSSLLSLVERKLFYSPRRLLLLTVPVLRRLVFPFELCTQPALRMRIVANFRITLEGNERVSFFTNGAVIKCWQY